MQRLLSDRMGTDIFFYSISIDPEWDTPAVLREYAEKFHAEPGWFGLYSRTDAVNPDGHLPSLMIGNEPTGQWMLNSAVDNPRFLAATIGNFLLGWKNTAAVTAKATRRPADFGIRGRQLPVRDQVRRLPHVR